MNTRKLSLPIILLGGFIALSVLSGCATVDRKITLNYAPVEQSFGQHSGEIAISRIDPPSTARNSRGEWIIGSINNVHGVHQANLLSDRSLGEWISEALLIELKHAGYTAVCTAELSPGAPRGILINDINAFVNIDQGAVSDEVRHELMFNVDVFLKGAKLKTFTLASRDKKTVPLSMSNEENEKIMLQSLQDIIQQIIPEIIALTDKK
jgi:hypothetical protein